MSARDIIADALNMRNSLRALEFADAALEDLVAAGYRILGPHTFAIGDRVTKIAGSAWTGRVVGFYSTAVTPDGHCVESENEPGSVQIYPAGALRSLPAHSPREGRDG